MPYLALLLSYYLILLTYSVDTHTNQVVLILKKMILNIIIFIDEN